MKLAWSRLAVAALLLCPVVSSAEKVSNEITVRRHALQTDLAGLLSVAPEPAALAIPESDQQRLGPDGLAELKTAYAQKRGEAAAMKRLTDQAIRADALEALETRFPALKSELMSLLFSATSSHYFDDKDRFLQQKQAELDIRAAAQKRAAAARTSARVSKYREQLGAVPDRATLDKLYDSMGARTVVSQSAVVAETGRPGQATGRAALSGVQIAAFKPTVKMRPILEPPSPGAGAGVPGPDSPAGVRFVSYLSSIGGNSDLVQRIAKSVARWSDKESVDPLLTMAFMGQESLFLGWKRAITALSPKGASGLMQLMPGTARRWGVSNTHDVDQNVMGGVRYINWLRDKFSSQAQFAKLYDLFAWGKAQIDAGRSRAAVVRDVLAQIPQGVKNTIAAYNAGEGAVMKYGGTPPYRETRAYVPGVLSRYFENYLHYAGVMSSSNDKSLGVRSI